jgi:hypothetical protein
VIARYRLDGGVLTLVREARGASPAR